MFNETLISLKIQSVKLFSSLAYPHINLIRKINLEFILETGSLNLISLSLHQAAFYASPSSLPPPHLSSWTKFA